jgi:hypothetical protein
MFVALPCSATAECWHCLKLQQLCIVAAAAAAGGGVEVDGSVAIQSLIMWYCFDMVETAVQDVHPKTDFPTISVLAVALLAVYIAAVHSCAGCRSG